MSQYQVRLHHCEDSSGLIYAPRDEDCYIRRARRSPTTAPATAIASSRRLSQERRLLQTLEASLDGKADDRKRKLYEKLQLRHQQAMQRIINDVAPGLAIGA